MSSIVYVSKQLVVVDENVSVANAVKLTEPKNIRKQLLLPLMENLSV